MMPTAIEKTQNKLLKHHGGNGYRAQLAIINSYYARHDDEFWQFWESTMAANYQSGDPIIDMGAGAGQFIKDCAIRYPSSTIYGLDAADYMLKSGISLPKNAQLLLSDLHAPTADITENSTAMIMANTVVHELAQPIKMFKAAFKWLKPGGRFCIIEGIRQPLSVHFNKRFSQKQVWSDDTSPTELDEAFSFYFEHNQYTPEDLVYLLESGGFNIISSETTHNGRLARIVGEKPFLAE